MSFFNKEIKPKLKHYGYTLKHKWNIIGPGRELGVGWGTLLKHDLDKLWDPKVVDAYSDYFYGPQGVTGTDDPQVFKRFRAQVEKHYARSPHHYNKLGKPKPKEHQLESVADVYSLLKSTGQTEMKFGPWYKKHKSKYFPNL